MSALDARLLAEFRGIVGLRGALAEPEQRRTYESDALTSMRAVPLAVLLPTSAAEVQAIVRVCHREGLPFVARGSGTGLSGGALPLENGIVISVARMNRVLEVDLANARVVVEPGVINLDVTARVAGRGFYYAPDPSSQSVCSIGGNVAENSGGAHCLKYGFTTTHVLGLDIVLPDGSLVTLGGKTLDAPGYDLTGVFVGSEGTLGVATKVVLRVVKRPESVRTLLAAFPTVADASAAVSRIIAAGILASAMEIMDALSIEAAEAAVHAGYPACGGLLLVELDGAAVEVDAESAEVAAPLRRARSHGVPHRPHGRGASALLEGAQGGVRGDGPDRAELHRPGRRDSAYGAAGDHARHRPAERRGRAPGRQRLPRRGRQPAPDGALRPPHRRPAARR